MTSQLKMEVVVYVSNWMPFPISKFERSGQEVRREQGEADTCPSATTPHPSPLFNLHFNTNSVMLLSPGNLARRRNIPDLLIRNASRPSAAEAKEIGYSRISIDLQESVLFGIVESWKRKDPAEGAVDTQFRL